MKIQVCTRGARRQRHLWHRPSWLCAIDRPLSRAKTNKVSRCWPVSVSWRAAEPLSWHVPFLFPALWGERRLWEGKWNVTGCFRRGSEAGVWPCIRKWRLLGFCNCSFYLRIIIRGIGSCQDRIKIDPHRQTMFVGNQWVFCNAVALHPFKMGCLTRFECW